MANEDKFTQGTTYEEEEFTTPNDRPKRKPSLSGTPTEKPATLDAMFNEMDSSSDDEENEEPSFSDDDDYKESIVEKLMKNKQLVIAAAGIVALIIIVMVVMAVSGRNKDDNQEGEVVEDTMVEEDMDIMEEPIDDPATTEDSDPPFDYTEEERDELRSWGYSNNEIESAIAEEKPAEDLVKEAREAIYDKYSSVYKNLLRNSTDSPDESYRYVLANSMFGLPIQVVDRGVEDSDYYSSSCLVDYYKIPLQGYQPTLKVKIPNTDVTLFVVVTPDQYYKLEDTGNIKISYDYIKRFNAEFYTNVKMIDE